jgi:2-polyprenyl-3-methyl-5-hydroxy-6-metoxy-1,4-benzoquinol methylase
VTGCRDYEYGVPYRAGYLLCETCGLARIDPLPSHEELTRFYPPDYANYSAPASKLSRMLMAMYDSGVRRQASFFAPSGSRVLDVGCGGGHYLDKLAGKDLELHGTEFSEDAARPARDKGHTVHVGALENLDLPPGHFRLIRLNHVIEHVLDPLATLRAASRLLAPGGAVVVETPNLHCPDFRLFGKYWGALHFPRHLHLFTLRTMGAAAEQAGLRVTKAVFTVMPTGWSLGLQNLLAGTVGIRIANGRCALYPFFMLGFLPFAMLQKLARAGTMMQVHLTSVGS